MNYKETKITKFLSGKGFYLVLAGCLVATGVAAWTAYEGFTSPDTAKNPSNNSSYTSEISPSTDQVQNETSNEPYSSVEEGSSENNVPETKPIVAENFIYPLSGNVSKAYSDDELVFSKTFGDMRLHAGLDISGDAGSAVNSCGNGIVVAVIEDEMLGRYVEIDHGNGIVARYCGLADNLSVKEGNIVSAGTKLGLLASVPCECADETHLHLEFYKDEYPVNPEVIIEG